ncbi:MAG: hypothetical protein ACO3YA_02585 [Candidatus Nanopelagicaceae bacterium]
MSPVTTDSSRNFQDLAPFSGASLANLSQVFSLGDSDPRWPLGPGGENALRLQHSLDVVAQSWGIPRQSLSVIGDRYMAFYLAIMGSVSPTDSKDTSIKFSPIEKKEILAIIDGLDPGIERIEYGLGLDGLITDPKKDESLAIFQLRNGETGITQETLPHGTLIIDATSALPADLQKFDLGTLPWCAVVLDATSWGGPRGVNYLAINSSYRWKNPFPTLDTSMPIFGANYGLTLMAALALEDFMTWDYTAIARANETIRNKISLLTDVDIAGVRTNDRLSLSFLYVQSEELQRALWSEGFLVDSGSACSSSALEPSHVLTRMGLLSHGNVRLKFRPENLTSVVPLAEALLRLVPQLRG